MIMNEAEKLGREKFHTGLWNQSEKQHTYQYASFRVNTKAGEFYVDTLAVRPGALLQ